MKAPINGIDLAYDDLGNGPAVVLIHSFPLCRQMWQPQVDALVANGYRVIIPDLRGFGESATDNSAVCTKTLADDIASLLTYLGVGRAVLVGISMTCGILLDLVERYPRRVAATCLLSPPMQPGDATEEIRRIDLAELIREGHHQTAIDNLCERLLPHQHESTVKQLTEKVRRWMEAAQPDAMANALALSPKRLSYRDASTPYPVPTLVLNGARDRICPVGHQKSSLDGVWKMIPGAGHLINLEAPEEVNNQLIGFLKDLSRVKLRYHKLARVA